MVFSIISWSDLFAIKRFLANGILATWMTKCWRSKPLFKNVPVEFRAVKVHASLIYKTYHSKITNFVLGVSIKPFADNLVFS